MSSMYCPIDCQWLVWKKSIWLDRYPKCLKFDAKLDDHSDYDEKPAPEKLQVCRLMLDK